jgi:hypothetical protein
MTVDPAEYERLARRRDRVRDPGPAGTAAGAFLVTTPTPAAGEFLLARPLVVGGAEVEGGAVGLTADGDLRAIYPVRGVPGPDEPILAERAADRWVTERSATAPPGGCPWPRTLLVNVRTNHKPCQTDVNGFAIGADCGRFVAGIGITVTGPSGYSESGVTGSTFDDLVFEFGEAGDYTITPTGGQPAHFDLPAPVTLTLGCSDAAWSFEAKESEGYVLLCSCPTYPVPRTLHWEIVENPAWSGTATYRDDLPDGHPWKYRFVGCASGTHKYNSAHTLFGQSYLSKCADSPYVTGPNNCVPMTADAQGVCWMIFACGAASLSTPGCPTVGRTCDEGDYFAGNCSDMPASSNYRLAVGTGAATITCAPFEATMTFGVSLMSFALDVGNGGTLRIYE